MPKSACLPGMHQDDSSPSQDPSSFMSLPTSAAPPIVRHLTPRTSPPIATRFTLTRLPSSIEKRTAQSWIPLPPTSSLPPSPPTALAAANAVANPPSTFVLPKTAAATPITPTTNAQAAAASSALEICAGSMTTFLSAIAPAFSPAFTGDKTTNRIPRAPFFGCALRQCDCFA